MTPSAPIRSLLFDLDGTLLDTSGDLIAASNLAVREFGMSPIAATELKPLISGGAAAMLQRTINSPANRHVTSNIDDLLERMLALYENDIAVHTRMFDGIEDVLKLLQLHNIPWGIVTNKAQRFTVPLLQAMHFDHPPTCVISGDTFPEKKPHPLPMLEASRQLGCPPEHCAYVGDARRDIEAGRNAGMSTLAASYGFVDADDPAHTWGADVVIDDPHQLLNWLLSRL